VSTVAQQPAAAPTASPVRIELAHSEPEARAAVRVLAQIWQQPDGHEPVVPELAWVFAHTGNYVALASAGGEIVASAIGFRAEDERGPYLHSHIAGVLPTWQGSNIGFVLKQHQRDWALANGLDRIVWTFDPLVARNAYFNVTKLGARLTGYHVNFYGQMNDGINDGDETDRCVATWDLDVPSVVAAARGEHTPADATALRTGGATVALEVGPDGEPVSGDRAGNGTGEGTVLVQVPADIVAMRATDPALGRRWREALREHLGAAFADGLSVTGVSRDSWYVLSR
jgi:predicted GNAT superfamily acetyltransferase